MGSGLSEAMFKKHLYRWGVFKNVVGSQRNHLVKVALAHYNAGICLPVEDSEGRVIPWDRVKRSCLRYGQHTTMWRSLDIPQQKPTARLKKSRSNSRRNSTQLKTSHQQTPTADKRFHLPITKRSDPGDAIKDLVQRISLPQLGRLGTSTPDVDYLLSCIPEFQSWRASVASQSHPSKLTSMIPLDDTLGDTEKEDAALNVLNDFIDLARCLFLGSEIEAVACFYSARANFSKYLQRPSYFLLYAVLVVYILPARGDTLLQCWKSRLLSCFKHSAQTELGPYNPLTRILHLLTSENRSFSSRWSIAVLACLANTADPFASEASKFTSIIIRHGLALDLCIKGYPFSAISVLKDIIADCSHFHHPILRNSNWSLFHLAELYQIQGMYTEARDVLVNINISGDQIPGGRLLCCYSLFGQLRRNLDQLEKSYGVFRKMYDTSCWAYRKDGPLTAVYARMYKEFLYRVGCYGGDRIVHTDNFAEMVQAFREVAHWRLKETPRRFITFRSAGVC